MPPNLVKNCNALANIKLTSDGWITNSAFRSRRFIACHSKPSVLNNAGVMWCAKESRMRVLMCNAVVVNILKHAHTAARKLCTFTY